MWSDLAARLAVGGEIGSQHTCWIGGVVDDVIYPPSQCCDGACGLVCGLVVDRGISSAILLVGYAECGGCTTAKKYFQRESVG